MRLSILISTFAVALFFTGCGEKMSPDEKQLRTLMKEDGHFQILKKYEPERYAALESHLLGLPVIPTDRNTLMNESTPYFKDALFYRFMYASEEDIYEMLAIEREQAQIYREKDPTICTKMLSDQRVGYLDDLYPDTMIEREERLFEKLITTPREGTPKMMSQRDAANIYSGLAQNIANKHFPPASGVSPHIAACDYYVDLFSMLLDMDPADSAPMLRTALTLDN